MSMDLLYDRATLQQVLDRTKRPYTHLRDTFFSNVIEHQTEHFGFDVVKGGEQIAPFVHPEIGGKMLDKTGYETKIFTPPEVSPEKIITSKDVQSRLAGEQINSRDSIDTRQRRQVVRFLRELDWSISRREEIMCAEIMTTGKLTIEGDGYPRRVLNFWDQLSPAEQPYVDIGAVDSTRYWDEANANIIDDLIDAADRVEDNSNASARMVYLGAGAAAAFRANKTLWEKMDNRRINPGELATRRLGGGVRYLGTLLDSGLEVYTYRGHYRDPAAGLRKPLIPDNLAVVGSPEVRTSMNYGLITLNDGPEGDFYEVARSRVPDSWMQRKKPAGRILQIKSRPMPVIEDLDGFLVLKVLGGS